MLVTSRPAPNVEICHVVTGGIASVRAHSRRRRPACVRGYRCSTSAEGCQARRHPGPPSRRGARRHRVPSLAGAPGRRLRRRGHVLRDLGLPDHKRASPGDRADRAAPPHAVLGSSCPAVAPRRSARDRCDLRRDGAVGADGVLALVVARGDRFCALLPELDARGPVGRLLVAWFGSVALPALLVSVGGGAVLPGLADPPPRRDGLRPSPRSRHRHRPARHGELPLCRTPVGTRRLLRHGSRERGSSPSGRCSWLRRPFVCVHSGSPSPSRGGPRSCSGC